MSVSPCSPHSPHGPLRVGVGGPVGSGKTALMDALCKALRDRYDIAAITNDIYTKEDAEFLTRAGALPPERIIGVETGGCPHTAIREDASMNLAAVAELRRRFPDAGSDPDRSGGDNLAATFSPELADLTIYVIDVAAGDKIPRKGGPGITKSRPARHQQDRSRALRRRRSRRDGARRAADARRAAVRVHEHSRGRWGRGGGDVHRTGWRIAIVNEGGNVKTRTTKGALVAACLLALRPGLGAAAQPIPDRRNPAILPGGLSELLRFRANRRPAGAVLPAGARRQSLARLRRSSSCGRRLSCGRGAGNTLRSSFGLRRITSESKGGGQAAA